MKRYLLFSGAHYYPGGGMNDFVKDFDNKNEATEYIKEKYREDYETFGKHGVATLNEFIEQQFFLEWHQIFDQEAKEQIDIPSCNFKEYLS